MCCCPPSPSVQLQPAEAGEQHGRRENKRSGAIETVKQRQPSVPFAVGNNRHNQKAKGKDHQRTDRLDPVRKPRKHFRFFWRRLCANQFPARQRTKSDCKHLDPGAVRQKDDHRSDKGEGNPGAIRAELRCHKFLSKIAEMRDRTAERGQAEPEEDLEQNQDVTRDELFHELME